VRVFGPILDRERRDLGDETIVRSPYDQRALGTIGLADADLLQRAIALVRRSFLSFSRQTSHQRGSWLRSIAREIERRGDELARTVSDESGKPIHFARDEVARAAASFWRASELLTPESGRLIELDQQPQGAGRLGLLRQRPRGPVAVICPFSDPLASAADSAAMALAAGCSVLVKPATQTPLSALSLGRVALEAGLPQGTLAVIPCRAQDAAPLVQDDRLSVLCFSGSAEVGWALQAQAGRKQTRLSLSSNAAAIVESDADSEFAAQELALAAFAFAGQQVHSVQRIFIHERGASRFYDTFLKTVTADLPTGDPGRDEVVCGPVIDSGSADRILDWVEQAEAAGCKTLVAPNREGNLITPTILTKVPRTLPIVSREVFGPVVILETYRGITKALELVNNPPALRRVSILTHDIRKVLLVQEHARTAAVIHNDVPSCSIQGTDISETNDFTEGSLLVLRKDSPGKGWLR